MKKHSLTMILFVIISFSCSNNDSVKHESINSIDYSALNRSIDNQISTLSMITVNSSNEDKFLQYFKTQPIVANSNKSVSKEKIIKIKLAPHYNKKENNFMLNFYQDLANSYDNKITELLNSKRVLLNKSNFSKNFKNEASFLFNTIEKTANEINYISNKTQTNKTGKTGGFGDCISQKGKGIGRGIVGGMVLGGISGAITGATVGTVSFPGLGTATGAVAGAVFGAAKGAITGGLVELTWAFIDCSMERNRLEIYYMNTEDFYIDFINPNDLDQQEFYTFNDSDFLLNSLLNTSEDTPIRFIE